MRADVEPKTFETQVFENGAGIKYSFILHFHFDLFHFLLASRKRKTCIRDTLIDPFPTSQCCCAGGELYKNRLASLVFLAAGAKLLMRCCARIMAVCFSLYSL